MSEVQKPQHDEANEPPPVLSTWKNVYVFVLANLLGAVVVLYALTLWASAS